MLSVLIVNWNTADLLCACLASIRRHPPSTPYEVIVVDNASSDGSAERVGREYPETVLVEEARNLGYAAGNNAAFERAQGEWLLTLNPDTEAYEDTFDRALDFMARHPRCGALGARQIGTDGHTQASVRGFPSFIGILGDLTGLGRRRPGSTWDAYRLSGFDYESEQPAPQPMGTFLLFRRAALEAMGDSKRPFDERFPIFFNEVDLLYRMSKFGWEIWYSPLVRILHHGGEGTRQVRPAMIWESHRSLLRFFRKHRGWVYRWLVAPWLAVAVYILAFLRARGYHGGFRP